MFSHINSTINGLTTIKSFNGQQISSDEYDELQDFNISSGFIFFALSRALSLWIDIVCILYMIIVLVIFFIYENGKFQHLIICCTQNADTKKFVNAHQFFFFC